MLKNIHTPTFSPFKMLELIHPSTKGHSISNFIQKIFPSQVKYDHLSEIEAQHLSHIQIMNHSALVSTSDLKGNIIHANELFCKTSKYKLEELIGKPHSIVRHPDTPASVFKEMWSTIGKGLVWQGELKNKAKDGSDYWVLATIAPVMDKNGKPLKYISVRYDITLQKKIQEDLEEAKKKIDDELLENIAYAKHIHSSFLSNDDDRGLYSESFLIYKPQKIISGDFYKIEEDKNKLTIVVGDSTGHGISASYISVLVLNILSRIMKINCEDPGIMLKKINGELNFLTHVNTKKQLIESADMIVCCIDREMMKLSYASARMRAFILRDNEILLLEKDKASIGAKSDDEFKITTRSIRIKKNDRLFIASDGLFDQLGGPKDKCITFKRILSLIKETSDLTLNKQKEVIQGALLEWQGNNEQTDDITLFGIQI